MLFPSCVVAFGSLINLESKTFYKKLAKHLYVGVCILSAFAFWCELCGILSAECRHGWSLHFCCDWWVTQPFRQCAWAGNQGKLRHSSSLPEEPFGEGSPCAALDTLLRLCPLAALAPCWHGLGGSSAGVMWQVEREVGLEVNRLLISA